MKQNPLWPMWQSVVCRKTHNDAILDSLRLHSILLTVKLLLSIDIGQIVKVWILPYNFIKSTKEIITLCFNQINNVSLWHQTIYSYVRGYQPVSHDMPAHFSLIELLLIHTDRELVGPRKSDIYISVGEYYFPRCIN